MVSTTKTCRVTGPTEHKMRMWDGASLHYRAWLPSGPVRRAVLLFHRGHEHSGRFCDVVEMLCPEDAAVFAWDARGHGRSDGRRGHAGSFATYVRDADCFASTIAREHGVALHDMAVLGHSVGAVIAASWIHDYAPPVRAMVLVAPAFRVKLYVPLAIPLCRLLLGVRGSDRASLKSYVSPRMLTHDAEQARRYADDRLITRDIAVKVLLDLHETADRLVEDAGAITTPAMVIAAGSDRVVHLGPQQRFFDRLASPHKVMRIADGLFHDVLHEPSAGGVLTEARRFLDERLAGPARPANDPSPASTRRARHERLRSPLPLLSPRRLGYAGQRLALRTVGRASRGIRLGWETGFDSGQTLDYVYRNRPDGFLPVGRLIDRAYLHSTGWRGVRERRANLQRLLQRSIEQVHGEGLPVHVLDIAAGPGRYVLDTLHAVRPIRVTARMRDVDTENLHRGHELTRRRGLSGVVFESGDAFDAEGLAAVSPRPTIAIASGIYELTPENEPVRRSLQGLARAVPPGGHLIYTNQPWHPQLEMIARVLRNREGRPWVMRCRPQAEIDELVREAGFDKVQTIVGESAIFTVSVARRRGAQR